MNELLKVSYEVLGNIEWAVSYQFELTLVDSPGSALSKISNTPFKEWLPCKNYNRPRTIIQTKDFNFGLGGYALPEGTNPYTIELNLYDDSRFQLINFFESWVKVDLLGGNEQSLGYLANIMKTLYIKKFAPTNDGFTSVEQKSLYVIPTNNIPDQGDSEGGAYEFQVELLVVGEVSLPSLGNAAMNDLNSLVKLDGNQKKLLKGVTNQFFNKFGR